VVEAVDRKTFDRAFAHLAWLSDKGLAFSALQERLPEFMFVSIEDHDEPPRALAKRIDRARAHLKSSLDLILTTPRRKDGRRSINAAVVDAIETSGRGTPRQLRASLSPLREVNHQVPSIHEAIYSARLLEHWLGRASDRLSSRPGDRPRFKGNPALRNLLVLLAGVFSTVDPKQRPPSKVPQGADGWFIQFSRASLEVLIERGPRETLPSSEALAKTWKRIMDSSRQAAPGSKRAQARAPRRLGKPR
jgi:hypothetical protein